MLTQLAGPGAKWIADNSPKPGTDEYMRTKIVNQARMEAIFNSTSSLCARVISIPILTLSDLGRRERQGHAALGRPPLSEGGEEPYA